MTGKAFRVSPITQSASFTLSAASTFAVGMIFIAPKTECATPAVAGDWEDAEAAYGAGDYQKAIRLFKPLTEQGGSWDPID